MHVSAKETGPVCSSKRALDKSECKKIYLDVEHAIFPGLHLK